MANNATVFLSNGTVIQEPKTSQTSTNSTWLKLSVAVTTTKQQPGSKYPASDIYNVNVYGKTAEYLIGKIKLKTKINVVGDMYMGEPWQDREGKTHISPVVTANKVDIISGGNFQNNNNNNNNTNQTAPADEEAPF